MGEWDVYCALCAGPFNGIRYQRRTRTQEGEPHEFAAEEDSAGEHSDVESGYYYDDAALPRTERKWMRNVLVLGSNPDATSLQKAFLSGIGDGQAIQFGSVDVPPGSDASFPREGFRDGVLNLVCYSSYNDEEIPSLPFHPECYDLLKHALTARTGHKSINLDALYDKTIALVSPDDFRRLGIKYGEPEPENEQYWLSQAGQEIFIANPMMIRGLNDRLKKLPSSGPLPSSKLSLWDKVKNDVFSKVPYDIIRMVLSYLPGRDVASLQVASWNIHEADLGSPFWKSRIREHQPWFWEVDSLPEDIDGRALSFALDKWAAFDPEKTSLKNIQNGTLLGLANRKRVWGVAEHIAELYADATLDETMEDAPEGPTEEWIKSHAVNRQMPPTMLPNPRRKKDKKQEQCFFVKSWREVNNGAAIELHWNSEAVLVGIAINGNLFSNQQPNGGKTDHVSLTAGDWLQAITIVLQGSFLDPRVADEDGHTARIAGIGLHTTAGHLHTFGSTSGAKRLLKAAPSHTLVGLIGQTDPHGISRLGLLECPRDEDNTSVPPVPQAETLLWKRDVLPPHIRALPFRTGYAPLAVPLSFVQQEALVLGTSHEELGRVRRIGVCVGESGSILMLGGPARASYLPMGLAVEYEGQERKTIGWYDEPHMHWFDIDGAAGEKLSSVGVGMNELPKRIEFTTSFGRSSDQYGDPQSNSTDWQQAEDGETLVGVMASFGYPCGHNPAARETGGNMYPKDHLGTTTINALAMRLPPVKGSER